MKTKWKLTPEATRELASKTSDLMVLVPDVGTTAVPFSDVHTDCAFLNDHQLKISALIKIDTAGAITSAVPRFPSQTVPDEIHSCMFQPYLDSNGYPESVTISYFPRPVQ